MMAERKEVHLTKNGKKKLEQELEELKGPKRTELSKRLRVAIQQGDLKENADYIKAKEDQGFLEGRIREIEAMLRDAVIISGGGSKDGLVGVGSTVTIKEEGREPIKYFVVGAQEADPRNGKISNESPIGLALIGHKAGETVRANTPAGELAFEILKVE